MDLTFVVTGLDTIETNTESFGRK